QPQRNVPARAGEDLGHVVARAQAKMFERELQRKRCSPSEPGSDHLQCHKSPRTCREAKHATCSVIECWRLAQPAVPDVVMLNPEGRARCFQESLDLLPGASGLLLVEIKHGNAIERSLLGKMVQVSGQQDRAGMLQPYQQHLVAGRMSRR